MVGIYAASGKRGAILKAAQGVANYELASRNGAGPTLSFTEIIGGDAEGRSRLPSKGGKEVQVERLARHLLRKMGLP
jgi:hypothetical protein